MSNIAGALGLARQFLVYWKRGLRPHSSSARTFISPEVTPARSGAQVSHGPMRHGACSVPPGIQEAPNPKWPLQVSSGLKPEVRKAKIQSQFPAQYLAQPRAPPLEGALSCWLRPATASGILVEDALPLGAGLGVECSWTGWLGERKRCLFCELLSLGFILFTQKRKQVTLGCLLTRAPQAVVPFRVLGSRPAPGWEVSGFPASGQSLRLNPA